MIGLLMEPCVLVVQLKEAVKLNYKPLSGRNVYFYIVRVYTLVWQKYIPFLCFDYQFVIVVFCLKSAAHVHS